MKLLPVWGRALPLMFIVVVAKLSSIVKPTGLDVLKLRVRLEWLIVVLHVSAVTFKMSAIATFGI